MNHTNEVCNVEMQSSYSQYPHTSSLQIWRVEGGILDNLKSKVLNKFHKFSILGEGELLVTPNPKVLKHSTSFHFLEGGGILGNLKSKVLNNFHKFSFLGLFLVTSNPKS